MQLRPISSGENPTRYFETLNLSPGVFFLLTSQAQPIVKATDCLWKLYPLHTLRMPAEQTPGVV